MQELTAWPPDFKEERRRRLVLWNKQRFDERFRLQCENHYARNPIDWINDFCVTFDPRRRKGALMPFMLFPRQREFIQYLHECWRDKEHGLCEKARDIGATWLACAFTIWLWRFHPGSVIGWGSLKADQVDKHGDPKAIFPKLRQIIAHLPEFMRPEGYIEEIHATRMKITNPVNGSTITGESGDSQGRGGRTTMYFKDESAHYEHPEEIEASLGDNTDIQIDMSSVNGIGNVFHRKRMAGVVWYPGGECIPGKTRIFIFAWSDHPAKTQAWHDMRERQATDNGLLHIFRQEVDRDYSASQVGVIIPSEWVDAAVDAHLKLDAALKAKYGRGMEDGATIAGQDVADGGLDLHALAVRKGVVMRYCDQWGGKADEAPQKTVPICAEYGVSEIYYDSIGVGASFKTEMNHRKNQPSWPPRLRMYPWSAGSPVLEPEKRIIEEDKESQLNKNQYKNLKAQAWFRLRTRFQKTFNAVKRGDMYPPEELISLDGSMLKLHELKMQLSQATADSDRSGKYIVDKTPDGTSSPNMADASVMSYCPAKPSAGLFDV